MALRPRDQIEEKIARRMLMAVDAKAMRNDW